MHTFVATTARPGTKPSFGAHMAPVADALAAQTLTPGHRGTLLAVIRHPKDRALFMRFLNHRGYRVCMAGTEAEARSLLRQNIPDLILWTDAAHGSHAPSFLDHLNANERLACIPVLMLSATQRSRCSPNAQGGGVVGHLIQPIRMRSIGCHIDATLQAIMTWNPLRDLTTVNWEQANIASSARVLRASNCPRGPPSWRD